MLESTNQWHLKGERMRMNNFIRVSAYILQLRAGGHFGNLGIFSVCSMHKKSHLMVLRENKNTVFK